MRRHIECNNLMSLAVKLKFGRVVAIVAVKHKEAVFRLYARNSELIEVLNPF